MTTSAISLREISMSYGKTPVLNRVSLEVAPGEIYGLIGSNGCGKSTLLRIIAGALRPLSGDVTVNGSCGFVSQTFALYEDLSPEENIRFFGQCSGLTGEQLKTSVEEVMSRMDLLPFRRQRTDQLSHGWRQRLKLAVALCHKPSILLLDEATAGIDPLAREEMWNIFSDYASSGVAILLATHHMDEAAKCNRIGYLKNGCFILSDPPAKLRARAPNPPRHDGSLTEALTEGIQEMLRDHKGREVR